MRGARLTCCCESSEVGHLRKTRRFEEGFLEKDWPKAGIRKHTSQKVQGDGQKGGIKSGEVAWMSGYGGLVRPY